MLTKSGSLGYGTFSEVKFHKQEKENILRSVGIRVEYGEPIQRGAYRGKYKTLGDSEHNEIIKFYLDGLSME